jgi:adenylosuccinate synthase
MARRIIALSGPIASGKTALGDTLIERYGFRRFKTRELLKRLLPSTAVERAALQQAGEALDRKTNGRWIADALVRELAGDTDASSDVIVDAVRIEAQIEAIRNSYGPSVVHVHLTAPKEVLSGRYSRRKGPVRELKTYEGVKGDPTEAQVEELGSIADIVIDTKQSTPDDVVIRVASHLGLYGRGLERVVDVLVGGQYGSEGKGQVAAYLAREYEVLVRVGGPNAGHKVFGSPPYTHHLLPSGTRTSNALLVLGPGSMLWLPSLLKEITECNVTSERLFIDPGCVMIDKRDREREEKLKKSIGSTAQGVGYATARKVLRDALGPTVKFAKDVPELLPYIKESRRVLEDAFARGHHVFLEGTQGTGLSLHHGAFPHVTSRDTSVCGCLAEAGIAPSRVRKIIMVCRTYPIRVQDPDGGTSGPMGVEITWNEVARRSGISIGELKKTERTSTTNRKRRVAEFDWTLLRKAASLNGPTDIALTFADYLAAANRDARRFEQLSEDTIRFIEEVERVAGAPVTLIATRFHSRSIIDRRAW